MFCGNFFGGSRKGLLSHGLTKQRRNPHLPQSNPSILALLASRTHPLNLSYLSPNHLNDNLYINVCFVLPKTERPRRRRIHRLFARLESTQRPAFQRLARFPPYLSCMHTPFGCCAPNCHPTFPHHRMAPQNWSHYCSKSLRCHFYRCWNLRTYECGTWYS